MVTLKEIGVIAGGIAGGAVLNEISKRVSTATGFPTEWANVGVGAAAMAIADKITPNPTYQDVIKLAGGVTAIGTVVNMVFKRFLPIETPETPGGTLMVAPTPVPIVKKEELVKVD